MKKLFAIALVAALPLLPISAFAGQCCMKDKCTCSSGTCCKDDKCGCKDGKRCFEGACKCQKSGVDSKDCGCKK